MGKNKRPQGNIYRQESGLGEGQDSKAAVFSHSDSVQWRSQVRDDEYDAWGPPGGGLERRQAGAGHLQRSIGMDGSAGPSELVRPKRECDRGEGLATGLGRRQAGRRKGRIGRPC